MPAKTDKFEDISLILKDLLKVIKVVSMYPEDNPLPQSLKRSFAEKLESIVDSYGDIKIMVEKNQLTFSDETVFEDRSKEESLAGIFFGTGITNFTFKSGLDVEDVYKLLDILKLYLNSPGQNLDLVAMIWEANISRFTFTTLEDIALAEYDGEIDLASLTLGGDSKVSSSLGDYRPENYGAIFDIAGGGHEIELPDDSGELPIEDGPMVSGPGLRRVRVHGKGTRIKQEASAAGSVQGESTIFDDATGGVSDGRLFEAVDAMGYSDLGSATSAPAPVANTALILNDEFKLSEEEEDIIAGIVKDDAEFDTYESTLELLKELLHQESEMSSFNETVTICEKVMSEFIRAGRLFEAGLLLQYLKQYGSELSRSRKLWSERVKDALVMAGSRERLQVLSEALNNKADLGSTAIRHYLDNFGWEALSGITDLLGKLDHAHHRETLCEYLATKGKKNLKIISRGLFDKNEEVVRNSIAIMSRIDDAEALAYLKKTANHRDSTVRLELVSCLKESPREEAIEILTALATDSDPSVRKEAVSSISSRRGRAAFDAITEIINNDDFVLVDTDDQQQLLNAFSMLGGELAVPFLGQLAIRMNLFRNSRTAFFRQAAFEALSLNPSEKAENLLVKLCNNWRPDIKSRARDAQYRRRIMIHGGDQ